MARNLKSIMRLIESADKGLPVEENFLSDLKRSIEMSADKDKQKPSRTYKPSGMNCIRASYYSITGSDIDENASCYTNVNICNSGSDIHIRIQTAVSEMRDNGIDCEWVNVAEFVRTRNLSDLEIREQNGMETKLYHKKYNLSFMCDGIIRYKGKYYILELKTENSYKFNTRTGVDSSHYKQATAYSLAFGLNEVIFVYISRDILDMKSYLFNVTDDMRMDLIGYIEECDSYVRDNKVPPIPENVTKKSCTYCGYKTQCRKDG